MKGWSILAVVGIVISLGMFIVMRALDDAIDHACKTRPNLAMAMSAVMVLIISGIGSIPLGLIGLAMLTRHVNMLSRKVTS